MCISLDVSAKEKCINSGRQQRVAWEKVKRLKNHVPSARCVCFIVCPSMFSIPLRLKMLCFLFCGCFQSLFLKEKICWGGMVCIKILSECAAGLHCKEHFWSTGHAYSSANKVLYLSLAASWLCILLWLHFNSSPQPWPVQLAQMPYVVRISSLLDPTSYHCLL